MTPVEVVNKLLSNPLDIDNVRSLTTPDVNYVSLNKSHPDLTRVLGRAITTAPKRSSRPSEASTPCGSRSVSK
jgi:hypothetical protein